MMEIIGHGANVFNLYSLPKSKWGLYNKQDSYYNFFISYVMLHLFVATLCPFLFCFYLINV